MQKIKSVITFMIVSVFALVSLVSPRVASAMTTTVSISQLPSYITTNSFKLSYSALSNDPSSITAQFYLSKNGGPTVSFGPAINSASGQVQVTSSEVNDQTNYTFSVNVSSNSGSASDSTSSFYDISGPSPVQGYYKEGIGTGMFKLHWKNPGDADFSKVVIYRGETQGFSADASHEIARVNGSPDSDMTYDENVPDSNKTYYYMLRALDKAGNSSSLVGDAGTTTTVTTTGTPAPGTTVVNGKVVTLPKEQGQGGRVLGEDSKAADSQTVSTTEPQGENANVAAMSSKKKTIGIVVGVALVLGALGYFFWRRNK